MKVLQIQSIYWKYAHLRDRCVPFRLLNESEQLSTSCPKGGGGGGDLVVDALTGKKNDEKGYFFQALRIE